MGAENRVTTNGRIAVWSTSDGGATWEERTNGLPDPGFGAIMREASASDRLSPAGIYFGTQSGSIFVSPNEGEEWVEAVSQLPPVLSVEVAESP